MKEDEKKKQKCRCLFVRAYLFGVRIKQTHMTRSHGFQLTFSIKR